MENTKYKIWRKQKYSLHQKRWRLTCPPYTSLSHDLWNYHYPNDIIENLKFKERIYIFTTKCDDYTYREFIRVSKDEKIFLYTEMGINEIE